MALNSLAPGTGAPRFTEGPVGQWFHPWHGAGDVCAPALNWVTMYSDVCGAKARIELSSCVGYVLCGGARKPDSDEVTSET